MLGKEASVLGFAQKAFSGKNVKKAKKALKAVKKGGGSADEIKAAKKSVKQAKDQRTFVRGTAAAGAGGAYIAKKKMDEEEPMVPRDY
jgi:hypothetical protein